MADRTRTVAIDVDAEQPSAAPKGVRWPWPVIAVVGAIGVALAGWIIIAGISTIVWLGASDASLTDTLRMATRIFALAHGAPADILGQHVTMVPLGLSLIQIFLGLPIVSRAARTLEDGGVEERVWKVAGTYALTYVVSVLIASAIGAGGATGVHTLLGASAIALIAGLTGASSALHYDPTQFWPSWLRAVPRAMGAAMLLILAASAIVLALAVWFGFDRIVELTESLAPDGVGIVVLAVMHLLYLPNLIVWMASWLLGAGVTLGDGSTIALTITDVGLLPAIPVLGAVPELGVASPLQLWWLVVGVVAGALAGLAITWARPRARFDETALVGGLAGTLTGLLLALIAAVASGGLGTGRLAVMGARVPELAIFGAALLGLSGMAAGLVLGLIRKPRGTIGEDQPTIDQ